MIAELAAVAARERDLIRAYDAFSPRYERMFGDLQRRRADHMMRVLSHHQPGRSFRLAVDMGCGTGILSRRLRSVADRVIGIDLSRGMLSEARGRTIDPRCMFRNADILARDCLGQSADLVGCLGLLSHIPHRRYPELARAVSLRMAPAGVAMLGVSSGPWSWFLQSGLWRLQAVDRMMSAAYNELQRRIGMDEHRGAHAEKALRGSFKTMGFAIVEVSCEDDLTVLLLERDPASAVQPIPRASAAVVPEVVVDRC